MGRKILRENWVIAVTAEKIYLESRRREKKSGQFVLQQSKPIAT